MFECMVVFEKLRKSIFEFELGRTKASTIAIKYNEATRYHQHSPERIPTDSATQTSIHRRTDRSTKETQIAHICTCISRLLHVALVSVPKKKIQKTGFDTFSVHLAMIHHTVHRLGLLLYINNICLGGVLTFCCYNDNDAMCIVSFAIFHARTYRSFCIEMHSLDRAGTGRTINSSLFAPMFDTH